MADLASHHAAPGVISFFSGCGILDLGFERAGFRTFLANEISGAFAGAYEHARMRMGSAPTGLGGVVRAGIGTFFGENRGLLREAMRLARESGGAAGFIGGPPCPDFSIAGKQAGHTGDRGRLTQDYFDLIGIERPDFFLFENVRGLTSTAKHRAFFERALAGLDQDGYAVSWRVVNAIDYGAPQDRSRVLAVGFHRDAFPEAAEMAGGFGWDDHATHRGALGWDWPRPRPIPRTADGEPVAGEGHGRPEGMTDAQAELTVQRWFARNGVAEHPNARDYFQVKAGLARMRLVPEGDTRGKSFKRLHRWRFSPTAAYGHNEVHLHPWLDRRLSAAEAMAMQTLPKEFELPVGMTLSDKFRTIGNGVPFLLALGIARSIAAALEGRVAQPIRLDPHRARTPLPAVPEAAVPGAEAGLRAEAGGAAIEPQAAEQEMEEAA